MKQFLPILFFLINTIALFAQKNELTFDGRTFKSSGDLVTGAALHYYRFTGARGSIGLSANFNTTQHDKKADYERKYTQFASLNLVRRWNLTPKTSRLRWNIEGGLSGIMLMRREAPYPAIKYTQVSINGYTDTIYEMYTHEGDNTTNYHLGLNAGSSLLFKLGNYFWGGLRLGGDYYWKTDQQKSTLTLLPGLEVSRTF